MILLSESISCLKVGNSVLFGLIIMLLPIAGLDVFLEFFEVKNGINVILYFFMVWFLILIKVIL